MIYAYIKKRHLTGAPSYEEQLMSIQKLKKKLKLNIDKFIIDDYSTAYCSVERVELGWGTGAFYHTLQKGDILLLHSLYTLTSRFKASLFIIQQLLQKKVKIYTADGVKLSHKDLKSFQIFYALKDKFDQQTIERTVGFPPSKLELYKEDIAKAINSGITYQKICRQYKVCMMTLCLFCKKHSIVMPRGIVLMKKRSILCEGEAMQARYALARGLEVPASNCIYEIDGRFAPTLYETGDFTGFLK